MDESSIERIDQSIANYLQGSASKDEIRLLETWIAESPENLSHFRYLENIWESSVELPVSAEKALEKVLTHIGNDNKVLSFWNFWQKVAAILIIALITSVVWLSIDRYKLSNAKANYNTVTSAFGSYSSLELPDGSKVWLNSGSQLKYPVLFNGKSRRVYLTGEAYFEVNSEPNAPFLVNTHYFVVKATGTRFNVSSYKNYRNPSVTLVEGKVAIQGMAQNSTSEIAVLHPQQHMVFDTLNGTIAVQTEDTYKHIAWKDGKLVFRNDLLSEVARRISLQYNVDIEIAGENTNKNRYRATFENEPLNEVLELLKISSPIDYKQIEPKLLPDGSFSKRKIIIYSTNE